jgi:hypothetical protein
MAIDHGDRPRRQAKLQPCPLLTAVEPWGDVVARQRRKTSLRQPQGPALLLGRVGLPLAWDHQKNRLRGLGGRSRRRVLLKTHQKPGFGSIPGRGRSMD